MVMFQLTKESASGQPNQLAFFEWQGITNNSQMARYVHTLLRRLLSCSLKSTFARTMPSIVLCRPFVILQIWLWSGQKSVPGRGGSLLENLGLSLKNHNLPSLPVTHDLIFEAFFWVCACELKSPHSPTPTLPQLRPHDHPYCEKNANAPPYRVASYTLG